MARASLQRQAKLEARLDALLSALADRRREVVPDRPDPAAWYERLTGRRLDPWQREVVHGGSPRVLLNCGRQVGKTELFALLAAYRALHLGRRVGILSPSLAQSLIVYRRARRLLRLADATMIRDVARELELPHGGAIVAFPGDDPDKSVRGDTLEDLLVDEAARIRDTVITAAAPTQATVSDHLEMMASTPRGRRGEFWREWDAGEGWRRFAVPSDACPRIRPEFLTRMRTRLGPLFAQEFECAFLADSFSLFSANDLDRMFALPPAGIDLPEVNDDRELTF